MSVLTVVALLSHERPPLPHGVVSLAVLALDSEHVERRPRDVEAISAVDLRVQVLVEPRQRRLRDVLVVDLPHLGHVGEAVGAHWAEVVAGANQLVEARLVDEMVTGRNLARLAACVYVLLADRAVGAAKILDALKEILIDFTL